MSRIWLVVVVWALGFLYLGAFECRSSNTGCLYVLWVIPIVLGINGVIALERLVAAAMTNDHEKSRSRFTHGAICLVPIVLAVGWFCYMIMTSPTMR